MYAAARQAQRRCFSKYRSGLFVGGNNVKALTKALSGVTGADFVVVDLEDAVGPSHKVDARDRVREAIETATIDVAVRLNGLSTKWGPKDFDTFESASIPLVFPKVESSDDLPPGLSRQRTWAMIETAKGVVNAHHIATHTSALIAGTQDLSADLRLPKPISPDRLPLLYSLQAVIVAARAERIACLDGVSLHYKDLAPLEAEALQGAALGFDGKTLIHPAQVPPVNRVFTPSEAAVEAAREIVHAWEGAGVPGEPHPGIATAGGKLIEELHYRDAKRVLALVDA